MPHDALRERVETPPIEWRRWSMRLVPKSRRALVRQIGDEMAKAMKEQIGGKRRAV